MGPSVLSGYDRLQVSCNSSHRKCKCVNFLLVCSQQEVVDDSSSFSKQLVLEESEA